jgi:molecular chaperone HtpG
MIGILFRPEPEETMSATAEKHSFQAEVNDVLSIVVNSLYSHREVFLRELISNASDAIDQLNLKALTDSSLLGDDKELRIDLQADKDNRTLTIRDNGAGMTRDELIGNLGTIARSGTRKLVETLTAEQKKDVSLIGQFGVGFYSAFLVADRVTVTSKKAGSDESWTWTSEAKGDFEITPAAQTARGTEIVLHLKEDAEDYVMEFPIRDVVRRYSDYVRWPIRLQVEEKVPVEGGEEGETTTELQWKTLNAASAIWTRAKSEITDEQYHEFYRHTSHDWQEPLAWTHFKVEGTHELTGLLYVPSKAPFDLFDRRKGSVRLFVKRVFIMDDAQEIVPEWLRFMKGVVDSEDLPLNVSREILQKDATTRFIKKQVVAKSLALLEELAKEGESEHEVDGEAQKRNRYLEFWGEFGRVLKEGVYHDSQAREQISGLLRYASTAGDELTSLADYKARMPEDQKAIYYVTADSLDAARSSPHIEALKKRGYEVLLMADPIDEWVVDSLREFDGTQLASAAKGALDLPETEEQKQEKEKKQKDLAPVLSRMHKVLDAKVKDVRVTDRLTDSPACLVADETGMSANMERILEQAGHDLPESKRILEVNPDHAVIKRMQTLADSDEDRFGKWTTLLHDQALLAEGMLPKDPAAFARQVADLMAGDAD